MLMIKFLRNQWRVLNMIIVSDTCTYLAFCVHINIDIPIYKKVPTNIKTMIIR